MAEVNPMTTQNQQNPTPGKDDPNRRRQDSKPTPEIEAAAKKLFTEQHGSPTWEAFEGDREPFYQRAREQLAKK